MNRSLFARRSIDDLAFADSEDLSRAYGAHALGRRPAVFHGYLLGVFHFPFGTALHAVSLHLDIFLLSFFSYEQYTFILTVSIAVARNLTA